MFNNTNYTSKYTLQFTDWVLIFALYILFPDFMVQFTMQVIYNCTHGKANTVFEVGPEANKRTQGEDERTTQAKGSGAEVTGIPI